MTATGVTAAATTTTATAATGLWRILFGLACKMCGRVLDIYLCEETGKQLSIAWLFGMGKGHYNEIIGQHCKNKCQQKVTNVLHWLGDFSTQ